MKLSDMGVDDGTEKILGLKLKPIIPTIESKINNKMLILQFETGVVWIIVVDREVVECEEYENMEDFGECWGTIKDFDNINKKEIGRAIMDKFPEVKNVWRGVL